MSGRPGERWPVAGTVLTGLLAVIVLMGGFTAWATVSRISAAIVATGQVEVEQHRQVVQHPDGGVVQDIAVTEGRFVEAGALLLSLDGSQLRTEHAIVEGQYFETLARRARLEAERVDAAEVVFAGELLQMAGDAPKLAEVMAGQSSLFLARRDTLHQSLEQLARQSQQIGSEMEGLAAQAAALARQHDLIARELASQQSLLDRGLAQASRVLGLEREAAATEGQLAELQARRAAGQIRQTELAIQRLRLEAERREQAETELRDLGYREVELAERRRGLKAQIDRLDIRAPVSGLVHALQVTTPRSVVRAAEPLLYVIPQDRPLVIAAKIPTHDIADIHPGQAVALHFAALPRADTPEILGRLDQISADALLDEATRTPYYRVTVTIPPQELAGLGAQVLLPGMPAEVHIRTGERSPMSYLVEPLSAYFRRAFREG
jgi:HlyD family type I secretion membrane fusion protein